MRNQIIDKYSLRWEILPKKNTSNFNEIIDTLLESRGIKTDKDKREFLNPREPSKFSLKEFGINKSLLDKAIKRIAHAIKNKEKIIVYGDYDADGICATAILWECLYALTLNVVPHIPDRFTEGYGLNAVSVKNLKTSHFAKATRDKQNSKGLIITVDNGIVANKAIDKANELGIDVIVTDHHQKGKKIPKAYSIIHTDKLSGSGISWVLAKEIGKKFKISNLKFKINNSLELASIGTIADQLPLNGINRSFAKHGLDLLNKTTRVGLLALFKESGMVKDSIQNPPKIGTYEVNYIIAPRINAMGRMEHAIDSLRLLCTKNKVKAQELAKFLGKTNLERQKIVDEVVFHARSTIEKRVWKGAIVLAHKDYHEGVIGLAASKLVEEYYRPVVIFSKGKSISKASARSISGFNIIESIRKLDIFIVNGGGDPMAAGFSIETDKIDVFTKKFDEASALLLTDEVLTKKLKIDMELEAENLDLELAEKLNLFEPFGIGNPQPVFVTSDFKVLDARIVGQTGKHLKLTLEKNGKGFSAIAFGRGENLRKILAAKTIDIAYNVEKNEWNGSKNLQLKIKDLKID